MRRPQAWRARGTLLLVLLTTVSASCERPLGGGHYSVPLVRLLANPEEFDSKRVLTSGYLRFVLNGPTIFLTEGDAAHGVVRNSVALVLSEPLSMDQNLQARTDEQYVAVTGLFEALGTGDITMKDVDDVFVYERIGSERN